MQKLIKYPSTPQFREFVGNIKNRYEFVGYDSEDEATKEAIYDSSKPKPTLTFRGSTKLHGTNSSFCYNDYDFWTQSKENILSIQEDNAGFCSFIEYRKDKIFDLIVGIKQLYNIDTSKNTIVVYGEYAGKGIQKNVGINNIDKSFFIFAIKVAPFDETLDNYWLELDNQIKDVENKIYNILDFKTYSIEIDFNHPELYVEKLSELVLEIENECPVSKTFGYDNTLGEGVVFTCFHNNQRLTFKSKGERHKNKTMRISDPIDDERVENLTRIANNLCPEWRLEQMLSETFNLINGGKIDIKRLGDYIKNVLADIVKEELFTLRDENIMIKDVSKYISNIARKYFLEKLDEQLGL